MKTKEKKTETREMFLNQYFILFLNPYFYFSDFKNV